MKYVRILLVSVAVALLLTGCEGGDGGGGGIIPTPPSVMGPSELTNFTSFVRQLVMSTSDTTEPVGINSIGFSFTEDATAFNDLFL